MSFHTPGYVIIPTIVVSYHTGMSSYPHMSFHTPGYARVAREEREQGTGAQGADDSRLHDGLGVCEQGCVRAPSDETHAVDDPAPLA